MYKNRPERTCVKCGIVFSGHRCKNCVTIRRNASKEKLRLAIISRAKTKISQQIPCPRCGASDWNTSSQCRPCRRKYIDENAVELAATAKARYDSDPEKYRGYTRDYIAANAEEVARKAKERYDANPAKFLAVGAKYREEHREEIRIKSRETYWANPEVGRQASAKYRATHPEATKAALAKWRKENRAYCNEYDAMRRAQKLLATPVWADRKAIRVFYKLAQHRQKATGIEQAVDHQVPLISPYVCGLHTEANLDVLTKSANSEKSNHWWPDMWEITPETPYFEIVTPRQRSKKNKNSQPTQPKTC